MRIHNDAWPDEMVEELTKRWDAGESASTIGKAINKTRNSVIGKAHRIGLAGRTRAWKNDDKIVKISVRKPRMRKPITFGSQAVALEPINKKPEIEIVVPQITSIFDLNAVVCHWPIGEVGSPEFGYCGRPICFQGNSPYCETHYQRAYKRVEK